MLPTRQTVFLLTALCGLVGTVTAAPAQSPRGPAPVTQSQAFVTAAAQANVAEMNAAQLALQVSQAAPIQRFAKQMIADHSRLGTELSAIAERENLNVPGGPSKAQAAQIARLQKMSGSAFNAAYAQSQVADHRQAVALFSSEATSGMDPQLRQFASGSLPVLRHHLQMAVALAGRYSSSSMTMNSGSSMGSMSSGTQAAGNNATPPSGGIRPPVGSNQGGTTGFGGTTVGQPGAASGNGSQATTSVTPPPNDAPGGMPQASGHP